MQDNVDGDDQRERIFNMYIKLLKLNMVLYQQVSTVFGLERVETELVQWFMERPPLCNGDKKSFNKDHYVNARLEHLWAIPNKSTSQLLINHKQYVLAFVDRNVRGLYYEENEEYKQLCNVLSIIFDDAPNKDANQRWLIHKLDEMAGLQHNTWCCINNGFKLLHPLIQPIDQCLKFFHRLLAPNINTLIIRLGPAFKQYYKQCEPYILSALDGGLKNLILLPCIIKCFGVDAIVSSSVLLLDHMNSIPLDANTFACLIKVSGGMRAERPPPTPNTPLQPIISQFVFKSYEHIIDNQLGTIIDGLMGVAELMMADPQHREKYGRLHHLMDAAITGLLRVNQYRAPNEEDIINRHR
ncbi:hypothetical protein SAMD00019534_097240 [Acytostelium subglobosum LB1]|uniref:hypothetical protein n=1 Tax=Acytostelium subglobosum LB1 TaxID=1410327 RepID=UPI000644935F|nr:hypothetical protein SAMD00019534_097240 [Acytostelium subglobosum LB1]GAM26549.1 hypothetical protein SAMD00019534_097240 [Acytostelium subglobosum LB1]|eukprot:XP_012750645.1 hypothetical protein SAMD00019534_097240 [Acytostelium subglobosum LB1]